MQEGDSENPACQSSRQPFAQISTLLQAGLANRALHDQRLSYRAPSVARCNQFDRTRRTAAVIARTDQHSVWQRSEEHTSELQSLMRISYAVFCLKQKNQKTTKE